MQRKQYFRQLLGGACAVAMLFVFVSCNAEQKKAPNSSVQSVETSKTGDAASSLTQASEEEQESSGATQTGMTTMETSKSKKTNTTNGKTGAVTSGSQQAATTTPLVSYDCPAVMQTKYPTDDVVVADYVVTDMDFGADSTGVKDSTDAIQMALYRCSLNGGGTVWMPAGKYRITSSIIIPAFVTLRGDWQDPDTGNSYGTIILADVESTYADDATGLFYIGGSAGVMGLTVYYPNQSIDDIKPYPYTFYVKGQGDGYMLQSIVNCTVINGYKGIGACVGESTAHEMMTVENFKGTFLAHGAAAYNQADVGTWKNVTISNKYWANAGAGLKRADSRKLDAYTRKNAIGLILGDLEWTEFGNVKVDNCRIGIHIVKGKRIEFAGSLYDVDIRSCDYGIRIDSMDTRWGMVLARSSITASVTAIHNGTEGQVRMTDVKASGTVGQVLADTTGLSGVKAEYSRTPAKPTAKLYVVEMSETDKTGIKDVSKTIQAALDKAKTGGGIVYLPAGMYRVDKPLTVPDGVELRGAGSVAQREQGGNSSGTLLLAYYGKTDNDTSADTATALVTLNGKNAGVRNVRFIYPNAVENSSKGKAYPYSYTIRGKGAGVYAVNVAIAGGYNGIDFRGCDQHYIKKFVGCCFHNTMHVGGSGGMIEGCLQNGTAVCRMGVLFDDFNPVSESSELFDQVFNKITRVQTTYIRISNAKGQSVLNTFAYGVKTLVSAADSTDTVLVNVGADNLGGEMLNISKGNLTAVNMMRWNGSSYINKDGRLRLYNRLTINGKTEDQTASEN